MSSSMRKLLGLPSRIALMLGLGALSMTAAEAAAGGAVQPLRDGNLVPQQSAKSFGEARIWSEGGKLFLAERGKPAEEIRLGDTAEARALRELLERDGATAASPGLLRDHLILVGGGGMGTHWAPADKVVGPDGTVAPPKTDRPAASGNRTGTAAPAKPGTNGTTNLAGAEKKQ